jgi:rubrerythrin
MSSSDVIPGTLRNLADIEKNAREVYRELFNELEDEELKNFISELIESEERHKKLVEEAIKLIEEQP